MNTLEEYPYEKELKFLIYRLALELKSAYDIYSSPDFVKNLPTTLDD